MNFFKFLCHHPIAFVNQCLYLFSEQTQLLEHYIFICYVLHVSPFGHHQVDFTTTYTEKYTRCSSPFHSSFIIWQCRMQQFLAVLRSFFHSSLLYILSFHPFPPTSLPSSLTSSCHLFRCFQIHL